MVIGRVYKICTDEKSLGEAYTDECYIGSTFDTLENRFSGHIRHYRRWINKSLVSKFSSSILFEKHGYENCHIELIKEYEVIDREHLEVYETLWIYKCQNKCINKRVPFCIRKIYDKVRTAVPWTCEICNITMRNSSKYDHLKSKKHQDNLSRE